MFIRKEKQSKIPDHITVLHRSDCGTVVMHAAGQVLWIDFDAQGLDDLIAMLQESRSRL